MRGKDGHSSCAYISWKKKSYWIMLQMVFEQRPSGSTHLSSRCRVDEKRGFLPQGPVPCRHNPPASAGHPVRPDGCPATVGRTPEACLKRCPRNPLSVSRVCLFPCRRHHCQPSPTGGKTSLGAPWAAPSMASIPPQRSLGTVSIAQSDAIPLAPGVPQQLAVGKDTVNRHLRLVGTLDTS